MVGLIQSCPCLWSRGPTLSEFAGCLKLHHSILRCIHNFDICQARWSYSVQWSWGMPQSKFTSYDGLRVSRFTTWWVVLIVAPYIAELNAPVWTQGSLVELCCSTVVDDQIGFRRLKPHAGYVSLYCRCVDSMSHNNCMHAVHAVCMHYFTLSCISILYCVCTYTNRSKYTCQALEAGLGGWPLSLPEANSLTRNDNPPTFV